VRIFWEQMLQPLALKMEKIDLLHCLAFVIPLASTCPAVVTVYDLSFLLYPDRFKPFKRLYLSLFTRLSVPRAKGIIAISENTGRDVRRLLQVPAHKIEVAYPGVDESYHPLPPEEVESFRQRRGMPRRMILFVGTLEPRKNISHLLEVYKQLSRQTSEAESQRPKLVIVGAKGWFYKEIFARVETLKLKDHVLLPGYVPDEELPLWYNAADVFVYPSLYEGFGLPPLEAMACGTPVIVADTASLPEVVGRAGLIVPPQDVDAWVEAIREVLDDEALRQAMRQRSLSQAARFSWTKMAQQTVGAYRRAMGHGGE
jgi:glycosyltransferase involved in cell wall biosynthesis